MTPPPGLGSAFQDINRLRTILSVLIKHGLGFAVERMHLGNYLPTGKRVLRKKIPSPIPVRVRMVLEELGPTFIKLGQLLSMHPDLLPEDYIIELAKLQDQVPPFSADEARQLIRQELGATPQRLFKTFDPEPLAAASIAQVHRATLKDGRRVALKLQRPNLKKRVESDLEILRFLAETWERFTSEDWPRRPVEFIDEFDRVIHEELDFMVEARHVERLRANFQRRPAYRFPAVDWEHTTTHCLALEFLPGKKILQQDKTLSVEARQKLARRLVEAYIVMALEDGFFHADPHGGNLLIDPQGRLGFLDAGQVGRLDESTVEAFTDMLLALVRHETDSLIEAYLRLGTAPDDLDERALKREVGIFLETFYEMPLEKISLGESLYQMVRLALKYRIQLPSDFIILAKTLLGAEGLARQLDPQLNLVKAVEPIAQRIFRNRMSPKHITQAFARKLREFQRFFSTLPRQLQDLLGKLQRGRLKIEFEHRGLEELQRGVDHASNRLSFALIVAALIVGSSLILASQIGPKWENLSMLGLIGFLLAGVLGLWLVISILRSGRF